MKLYPAEYAAIGLCIGIIAGLLAGWMVWA